LPQIFALMGADPGKITAEARRKLKKRESRELTRMHTNQNLGLCVSWKFAASLLKLKKTNLSFLLSKFCFLNSCLFAAIRGSIFSHLSADICADLGRRFSAATGNQSA
jgi:hypothetical protein